MFLGEEPSKATKVAIPVVLFGVALVSGVGQTGAFGDDPLLGTLFALLAAVLYGTFLLIYRQSNRIKAPAAGPLMEPRMGQGSPPASGDQLAEPLHQAAR